MINRQRMLLDDLDSEGFPVAKPRDPLPLLALNLGRIADHGIVQALLADHKCLPCNPNGWDEADGVKLPAITWADAALYHDEVPSETSVEVKKAVAEHLLNGITRLSDSYAPDAYFGHKR